MKKYIYMPIILLLVVSCNLLEKDVDTNLTKETIFSDERFAPGFLNSAYRELINGYNRLDNAMFACATDEAICSFSGSMVHGFNNGALSPSYNPEQDVWKNMYIGIRKTNIFLSELKGLIKNSGLIDKDSISKSEYKRMKGEALFLRGMYHFELAKRFENIQLVDTVLTIESALKLKQSTYEEAIKFIVNDCDSASFYLSNFNADPADYGRATKVSALALKSRALLYLASPLNNPTNDKLLWKAAADAAKAVMDIQITNSNKLNLFGTYYSVFTVPYNIEIIFATSADNSNSIELYNNPISFGGKGYTNPTQELVDSYEMINGKTIVETGTTYNPANPYFGRDPRLMYTIGYNGLKFAGNTIDTYIGGKDGINKSATSTKTGYYLRKYIDQNLNLAKNETRRRPWIIFRYAEILLNYAESMNEYLDAPDKSVYDALNLVRKRAGIKTLNIAQNLSKDDMRKRIWNERRVEFAFEEHRFWDVRRWNIGEATLNKPIHGMQIVKNTDGTFTYSVIEVENRIFYPKMNYYPIPLLELLKDTNLKQNPGW